MRKCQGGSKQQQNFSQKSWFYFFLYTTIYHGVNARTASWWYVSYYQTVFRFAFNCWDIWSSSWLFVSVFLSAWRIQRWSGSSARINRDTTWAVSKHEADWSWNLPTLSYMICAFCCGRRKTSLKGNETKLGSKTKAKYKRWIEKNQ